MFYEATRNEMPALDVPSHQFAHLALMGPARRFWFTGYVWRGVVVPRANLANVAAYRQIEDKALLPPGSWLLGFSGASSQAAGFRFRIFDVGADDYALSEHWDSNRTGAQDNTDTDPANPYLLPEPYFVVSPGTLQVQIVNSASLANDLQLLLHFAIPVESLRSGNGR
jgi:hypothetical protein